MFGNRVLASVFARIRRPVSALGVHSLVGTYFISASVQKERTAHTLCDTLSLDVPQEPFYPKPTLGMSITPHGEILVTRSNLS